jgi:hypothetical protein
MSGTAAVQNTFASQSGNIPLSQLDANFSTVVAYLNDPTNRNNYAADSGSANTYAVAISPPALGYSAGLEITFRATNANTGAAVLNVNALGAVNLINGDGTSLSSGQIAAGSIVKATHNGTAFIFISAPSSPPVALAVPHAWVRFSGTGSATILSSYNVASVTRGGTGTYTVIFATGFSSTAWAGIVSGKQDGANVNNSMLSSQSATSAIVTTFNAASEARDYSQVSLIALGESA